MTYLIARILREQRKSRIIGLNEKHRNPGRKWHELQVLPLAVALRRCGMDFDWTHLHAQLLSLLRSLRRNLQTTAQLAANVDLGAALLVLVGSTVATGLLAHEALSP